MSVRERFYLFMVFMAPLSSAFGLWTLKSYFVEGVVFSKFNIPLFLIGAFLRPIMHLLSSVEKVQSCNTSDTTEKLLRRVEALEHEISFMRSNPDVHVPVASVGTDSVSQKKLLQLDKRMFGMEAVIRKRLYSENEPKSLVLRLVYPLFLFFGWPFIAIKKLFIG